MKKISKLSINKEKIMKNEELTSLRGGNGNGNTTIKCYSEGYMEGCMGYLGSVTGDCDHWQTACRNGGFNAYCAEC